MQKKDWLSDLGAVMPVDGNKIAGFKTWICWNGFNPTAHVGFDFACYLRKDNKIILGLPPLEVCSILDGKVMAILVTPPFSNFFLTLLDGLDFRSRKYFCGMVIEHNIGNRKLYSIYWHVNPLVIKGQEVKRGETIATLYKSPSDYSGELVHLHFAFSQKELIAIMPGVSKSIRFLRRLLKLNMDILIREWVIDPAIVFPSLTFYLCDPQCSPEFSIPALGFKLQKPAIANFKKLLIKFTPRKP